MLRSGVVSLNRSRVVSMAVFSSYSLYDELGRVVEAGEKTENPSNVLQFKGVFGTLVSGYYNPITVNDSLLNIWVRGGGARKEVTKSYYDQTAFNNVPNFNPNILTQRKRIVHVAYYEMLDTNHLEAYDHATHYDYDIHGNVKTLIQDNQKMEENFPSLAFQRYKQVDYTYDLISGNVHRVAVQTGQQDQWHHAYQYDADNRITNAYTNKETPILSTGLPIALENELLQNSDWQRDARYHYYNHGPLSRTELGKDMLQGMDYTYTLQGWMKGINATSLDSLNDPGLDAASGLTNNPNSWFAKDVMSFGLHYYNGDYTPISSTLSGSAQANIVGSDVASYGADLYNGNIRAMQTTLTHPGTYQVLPQANAYEYDQLNRLKSSRSFTNLSANNWQAGSVYSNKYFNTFEYDAMGNILTQKRHKQDGTQIEDMTYRYQRDANGFLLSNRLYHVNDAIDSTIDATDIDDQGAGFDPLNININGAYNYVYDEEGRLIKDKAEDIQQIVWRVDGKVKEINRSTGSTMARLKFDYDAMGRRIAKHVYNNQTGLLEKSTYYLLDAQGNTMATYDYAQAPNQTMSFQLKERHIYGSTRLGMYAESVTLVENPSSETTNMVVNQGFKYYEMTNHLGNVLTVIHDIKIPLNNGSGPAVSSYRVGIRNSTDYSPFGVELDGRTVSLDGYRFGYQGSEKDNEFKGDGNSYTTEFRQLDPRLGRWLSVDPKAIEWESPFVSMGNIPLGFNDKLGDSIISHFTGKAANEVMIALMKTRLGRKYVGNYAAKGQKVGGYTFKYDGKYHLKGVDIHLFDQSGIGHQGVTDDGSTDMQKYSINLGPAGVQSNGRYRININLNTNLDVLEGGSELIASNRLGQFETNPAKHIQIWNKYMIFKAQTFLHELLIHTELSAQNFMAGKNGGMQARENDHLTFGRRAYKSVKWTVNSDGSYNVVLLKNDFSTPYLYDGYNISKELHKMYHTGAKDSEIYNSLLWGLEGIEQ